MLPVDRLQRAPGWPAGAGPRSCAPGRSSVAHGTQARPRPVLGVDGTRAGTKRLRWGDGDMWSGRGGNQRRTAGSNGGQIRRFSLLVGRRRVSPTPVVKGLHCHSRREPQPGARRRSGPCGLRFSLAVDGFAGPSWGWAGSAVAVRRHCTGGLCACRRLHGRRLRDCAHAARFARARPDGRPAGALDPDVGAASRLVRHTTRPGEAGQGGPHEPLHRQRAPHEGPEVPGDRERDCELHAAAGPRTSTRPLMTSTTLTRQGTVTRSLARLAGSADSGELGRDS